LLLVLDTNEYIFGFGLLRKPSAETLLNTLLETFPQHTIRIPRMIVEEVSRHLTPEVFREFIGFVSAITTIDEDILVPFELGAKYEVKGLKSADAFVAAYVEWTGADVLVTENRHFLSRQASLPFKVLTAEKCLKLIELKKQP